MGSRTSKFSEGIIPDAGIYRNNSPYYDGYKWVDGNNVRFSSNVPEKLGGWTSEIVEGDFLGVPRRNLTWSSLDSSVYSAIGTHLFLYIRSGGTYANITPFRDSNALVDVITTVITETEITITDVANGSRLGDWINIPSSVTYNGITLLGNYEIIEVIDVDNYKIETGQAASASGGPGGGAITINYYLEAGLEDSGSAGFGWGVGEWGEETWGDARSVGLFGQARLWCLQNWGEDLLALPIGGKLYFWDTSVGTGTPASEVVNAPDHSNFMIVASKFRQVILFGTEDVSAVFDPMLLRWSASEDYTTWVPATTNSAGEFRLTRGNYIVAALETKNGEILVWTDTALYRMTPVSTSDIYRVDLVGESCGLIAPFAAVEVDGTAYWQSQSSYKMYTGQVRTLDSSVEDYVFDPNSPGRYSDQQTAKFHVGVNGDFNELWFFYVTKDQTEINRLVIHNYGNNSWYDGSMERTCWYDKAADSRPVAYNSDGVLYIHEQGNNDDSDPMDSYVRTGDIDLEGGNSLMLIDSYMPDGDFTNTMSITLTGKKRPHSSETSTKTYSFEPTTDFVSTRVKGRLMSVEFRSNVANGYYKLGKIKLATGKFGGR